MLLDDGCLRVGVEYDFNAPRGSDALMKVEKLSTIRDAKR
jgi:hypothetical protein